MGVAYPCFCSRKQIRAEVEEAGRAPHGPSGEPLYPGICRSLPPPRPSRGWRAASPMPGGSTWPGLGDHRRAHLARPPRRRRPGRSAVPRRHRHRPKRRADELSSGGDGRRPSAGGDADHARRGPFPRHPHPSPAAGAAGAARAVLLPPQPDRRFDGPADVEAQPGGDAAASARDPPHAGRDLGLVGLCGTRSPGPPSATGRRWPCSS